MKGHFIGFLLSIVFDNHWVLNSNPYGRRKGQIYREQKTPTKLIFLEVRSITPCDGRNQYVTLGVFYVLMLVLPKSE